nr:MAG TPA: hypothetical protein [Caudoviricetes sp.]
MPHIDTLFSFLVYELQRCFTITPNGQTKL